jgi:hypothetical protein
MADQINNIPKNNNLPPQEVYRQPGAFEHGKKNWFALHHLLAYTLIGLVFLAIIAGAYYYQVSHAVPDTSFNPPVHHECKYVVGGCASPKVDYTADWKTYSNKDYGFEFKYPSNENIRNTGKSVAVEASLGGSSIDTFSISVSENIKLNDWIQKEQPTSATGASLVTKSTDFNFLGLAAKDWEVFGFDHTQRQVIFEKDGDVFSISYESADPNIENFESYKNISEQILSTFKFITPSNLPSEISSNTLYQKWAQQKKFSYGTDLSTLHSLGTVALKPISTEVYDGGSIICNQGLGDASKCVVSPDKSKTISIITGGEPDSDLYLYDKTAKTSSRLINCGTPCGYEDGFWLDNNRFVFLETDLDMDYSDPKFDIYSFKVIEFDFGKKQTTTWQSDLRIQR